MNNQILGLFVGLAGGAFRAILGYFYAKAKNKRLKFNKYLFFVTLIEGIAAGALLGSMVEINNLQAGISLALASAGLSEVAGKTGLHDALGAKKKKKKK